MKETLTGWIERTEIVETTSRHLPAPEPGKHTRLFVAMMTYLFFGVSPLIAVNLIGALAVEMGAPDWFLALGVLLYVFGVPLLLLFSMWKNQALTERVVKWPKKLSERLVLWMFTPIVLLKCLFGLQPWRTEQHFSRQRQRIPVDLSLSGDDADFRLSWQARSDEVEIVEETSIEPATAPTAPEPAVSGQMSLEEGRLALDLFRSPSSPETLALEIRNTDTGDRVAIALDPSLASETDLAQVPILDRPTLSLPDSGQTRAFLTRLLPIAEAQGAHIPRGLRALHRQLAPEPATISVHSGVLVCLFFVVLGNAACFSVSPPGHIVPMQPGAAAHGDPSLAVVASGYGLPPSPQLTTLGVDASVPFDDTPVVLDLAGTLNLAYTSGNAGIWFRTSDDSLDGLRFGARLGGTLGTGDLLGLFPFRSPFVGASGHLQLAWTQGTIPDTLRSEAFERATQRSAYALTIGLEHTSPLTVVPVFPATYLNVDFTANWGLNTSVGWSLGVGLRFLELSSVFPALSFGIVL